MTSAQVYLNLITRPGGGTSGLEMAGAEAAGLEMAGAEAAGLEAAGGREVGVPDKQELLDRLRLEIDYVERKAGVKVDRKDIEKLVGQADEGLRRLLGEGADAQLDGDAISGLEAVVRTDGSRPVLFVEDDFIDVKAPSIGSYKAGLSRIEDAVRRVCQAVGRVDDPSASLGYQGTAWVVAEGLVATNYHVLRAIAPGGVRRDGKFEGELKPGVAVHFGHEVGGRRPERRFPISRVVSVGREGAAKYAQPGGSLNFDGLDLAILELERVPGRSFPAPNRIARGDDPRTRGGLASTGRGVYVIGYPGNEHSTTPDMFAKLFDGVKSFKRLAPGRITAAAGDLADDPRAWILAHDASTLGGNSGSALADYDQDGQTLLGLHFAGQHARQNWAHALERITPNLAQFLPPPG
jgi:glutamyl endopeptidase